MGRPHDRRNDIRLLLLRSRFTNGGDLAEKKQDFTFRFAALWILNVPEERRVSGLDEA